VVTTNPLDVMPTMSADLVRVEGELLASVTSQDPYLTEIAGHLIKAGGKRVRPGFCIAAAATAAGSDGVATADIIKAAVSVELVHLGSLYHDDVMDDAITRRTVESVNAKWGNLKAILAGDFLLARASEIASSLGVEVAGLLASTIARLCEGQVLELRFTYDTARTEDAYLRSIDGKTAALLACAAETGALLGAGLAGPHASFRRFGRELGLAFQIVDDLLGIWGEPAITGKPAAADVRSRKKTLPILHALQVLGARGEGELARLMAQPALDEGDVAAAIRCIEAAGAREHAAAMAEQHTQQGLAALEQAVPPSPARRALRDLALRLVGRDR